MPVSLKKFHEARIQEGKLIKAIRRPPVDERSAFPLPTGVIDAG
jgi:hypothetical protein